MFSFSDAILNITELNVFKQEAPSPTNDPNFPHICNRQKQAQNHQNPLHPQQQSIVQNDTSIGENSNTNILNNTLNQLFAQNGFNNLQNVIEGKFNLSLQKKLSLSP